MGALNHPRRLLGFLLAAALALGALSCHNNSLPVAPIRSASLKVKVKVPTGVHASTNYELALFYVITGTGAAPVTGIQGPFSSASLTGTIDFSVDVSGAPAARVMAFQLNDTSNNGVVAIGACALNLTGTAQDLTVQLGSVTRTGYNVSGLSPPGSYGFDGNLTSGLAQSQAGYDINVTGSSPNYQFASAYTPNNISYLGNGDIVNFAFVPSSPASFFANSTLAKNNAGLSATDLAVGDVFCVQLSTGGYAWVQITDVGVTGPSFFFRTNTTFPYYAYQQTTFDLNYVTPTFTPSVTPTETVSSTPVFTDTSTNTPADTDTLTVTATPSATVSPTSTGTATPTGTSSSTATDTTTPASTWTSTPTNSSTSSFTATPSPTNTFTITNTLTDTLTITDTSTSTSTVTQTPTDTSTVTNSPTNSPTVTNTPTNTSTITDTPVFTYTVTDTPTITDTPTSTPTITQTPTGTSTITNSPTNSPTVTNTPTNTSTITDTPVFTYTVTDTPTITDTPTSTPTITFTLTDTATATDSPTVTDSPTNSFTMTGTPTATETSTNSATASSTGTATGTLTVTPSVTVAGTATQTWNPTVTGGALSGSVSYTGSLGTVDANHPIWVGLFNAASFNNPVTYALVNTNGGSYNLQSKVPGTYYVATSYEAFGGASSSPTGNGALSGNPFVVYGTPNNCVPGSGAPVTLNQFSQGPAISFADDCKFEATTLTGTVSYSGSLGSVDAGHPLWVGLFASANLAQVQGGPLTYTLVNSNNGTYNLVVPGPGLFYLAYSYEANGGPSPNPTGSNGNSGNPFRAYANTGANCSLVASQGVTLAGGAVAGPALSLDDSCLFAATSVTPTATPTSSVIQLGFDGTLPVTVSGDTSLSQDRYNQPVSFQNDGSYTYYGQGAPDVAYSFHLNTAQSVFINLCGATFDSVVYVRTSLNDPNSTVAMDDDSNFCGAGFTSSSLVTGTLQPGTYYVIVDGYSFNDEGSYSLSLSSFTPNTVLSPVSQPVPEVEPNNDDNYFENATDLGTITTTSDLVGLGKANYFTDSVDTWHFHVGSGFASYTISLDGFDDGTGKAHMGFDIYQQGEGTYQIGSSSDNSEPNQVTLNLSNGDYIVAVYAFDEGAPGGDYKLVVQGNSVSTPSGTLTPTATLTTTNTPTITPTLPPVTEITVPSTGFVFVNGDTTSLGDNFSESVTLGLNGPASEEGPPDVYAYGVGAPDQTYYFVLDQPESLYMYVSGVSFDSVIYVRTNPYDPSTTVALDDDSDFLNGTASSLVTGTLQAGVTYYVTVDGYNPSDMGSFTLNVGPFTPNCALASVPSVVAEVEPNNDDNNFTNSTNLGTASSATTLEGAGTVNYYFDNVDTWNFTVNEDGNYTVSLDCFDDQTGKARLGFDLYEYGELINSSDDLTEPNQITQDLPPGNYQIAVYAFDAGAPSGDYKLFVQGSNAFSPTETPVFSFTATDTPTITATPPPVVDVTSYIDNGSYAGDTTGAPDNYSQSVNNGDGYQTYGQGAPDAVYSFHLNEPKSLALECHSTFQSLIYLKTSPNNFSNTIAFDEFPYTESETDSALVTGVLQPGTYYIVVDGYDSESFGTFNLTLSTFTPNCGLNPSATPVMEIEPNNDDSNFTKATFLGNVTQGSDTVGQGHLDAYFDNVDTWRFTVTTGGTYTISADCFDDGTDRSLVGFDLYNSRHLIVDDSADDGEPDQMTDTLQPGNYFVAIYDNDDYAPSADYHLVVQGYAQPTPTATDTDTGTATPTGTLDTPTVTATPTSTPTPIVVPTDGSGTTIVVSGDTTGDPNNFTQNGYGQGPDVAYKIHIDNPARLLLSLCGANFDTVLYIRSNLNDPGSLIALNDDYCSSASQVLTPTMPAGDYYVIVDGYSAGSYGPFNLQISQFVTQCFLNPAPTSQPVTETEPNNDDSQFTNTSGLGIVAPLGDIVGQGVVNETTDPVDTWRFSTTADASCTISLDCFDNGTGIANVGFDIYDSNLNFIDSSDDESDPNQVVDELPPGAYYLAVYPLNDSAGDYHIVVQMGAAIATFTPTPVSTPTAVGTPITITGGPTTFTVSGDTSLGLDNFQQPLPSGDIGVFGYNIDGAGAPDVAYKIHLDNPMNLLINLCGSFYGTVIYLRTNLTDPNSAIALNDYSDCGAPSLVTGTLPSGDYYVIVDGVTSGYYGAFTMNISQFVPNCNLSPNAASTITESEPNNDDTSFTNPNDLGSVSTGNDVVGSGKVNEYFDPVDTWKFTVGTSGTYTMSLDCFDDGNQTTHMGFDLYDSGHNLIDSSLDILEPDQITDNLSPGVYYLAVYPADQNGDYTVGGDYHLIVQAAASVAPTSATIPSDGTTLILNGDTTGALDSNRQFVPSDGVTYGKGEPDVTYALSVTQAGSFDIQCNGVDEGQVLYPVIYLRTDPNDPNSAIGFDNSGYHDSDGATIVTGLLPIGTYYVIVDGNFSGDAGAFNLNVSSFNPSCFLSPAPNAAVTAAEVEPNNDTVNFTKPTFLGTVGQGTDLVGAGSLNNLTDTVDTWHFKASTTGGTYAISLDCFDDGTGAASAQISLYDSRHNQITYSSYNSPGQPNQIVQFLPQGDYYIAVQSNNDQQIGPYHLVVQGSAPPTPTFTPTATSTPPYSAPTTWTTFNGSDTFYNPGGVALDGVGGVYVADEYHNRILKFDTLGAYQTQFTDGGGTSFFPNGLAVNSAGTTVFTADNGSAFRFSFFSGSGSAYSFAGSFSTSGSPNAVALDGSGNRYVIDGTQYNGSYNYNNIIKYGPTGNLISTWGGCCIGAGDFGNPVAVAVNSAGTTVYGADNSGDYVNVYSSTDGTNYTYQFQFSVPGVDGIGGIALDGAGNVYVAGRYGGQILIFDPMGNGITELGGNAYGGGIAVDSSRNIYETDSSNNRVLIYNYLP